MKLIPKAIAKRIPKWRLGCANDPNPVAYVKLFKPDCNWTWYITHYDPASGVCRGLVVGHATELGDFSLNELETLRAPMGLAVERDILFEPTPLSELAA